MEVIFHEKQEGSLCAVHCLNGLLQGPYFTPVDLGTLAKELDEAENELQETRLPQSCNMDDSGYFSVQVISKALQVWGLEMVPYMSSEPRAVTALMNPAQMEAFICHYRDHWFAIRKIYNKWYNLNSLLSGPQLITETYLSLYLAQLRNEGYSIFIIFGNLPEIIPDLTPAATARREPVIFPETISAKEHIIKVVVEPRNEEIELNKALELSLSCHEGSLNFQHGDNDDHNKQLEAALQLSLQEKEESDALERALAMSLEFNTSVSSASEPSTSNHSINNLRNPPDIQTLREKRLATLTPQNKS